ncbi:Ig-like domain-containing protein [Chitinimonas lacunae]|uniref:Ig-like domain-containing protein n=1 Tax=Chitinimonas lacunae TaxID=1963018 RepID=A0ABV8MWU8_9NEIS
MTYRSSLPISALCAALLANAVSADTPAAPTAPAGTTEPQASGVLQYVGSGTRIGIGVERHGKLRGELYQILGESERDAWIAEGWFGNSAGGLSLHYHLLPQNASGAADRDAMVRKFFLAVDQNRDEDRKVTLGFGLERPDWFGAAYLSRGFTGRRETGRWQSERVDTVDGSEAGRAYRDTITTTTVTRYFERAYDYGIGLRAGRHLEDSGLRLTGGLDYEWGRQNSHQTTASFEAEKFFSGTPHSLALRLEAFRKSGRFETKRDDHRAALVYRYEFGKSYRPEKLTRQVRVEMPAGEATSEVTGVAESQRVEKKIVKTTASMSADAFFEYDRASLTDAARAELDQIAATLKQGAYEGNIRLVGHTCDLGTESYNLKLSQRRAEAVRDYLVAQAAVPVERIVVEGKGESEPKYPATKAERHKNRRVELEFVTFTERVEETLVPETKTVGRQQPVVSWRTEVIEQEPVWMRRALHHTVRHKQAVDVYRSAEESSSSVSRREFLNRGPLARPDAYGVDSGASLDMAVLANDSDPDGDALTLVSVSGGRGTLSIVGDRVRYQAPTGYQGPDSFSYVVRDIHGLTATATVTVTVSQNQANRAPIARTDMFYVGGLSETALDVLGNDEDPDGDSLTITAVTQPANATGTVSIVGNRVLYRPKGVFLADRFTYTISDGRGGTATATVNLVDP